MVRRTLPGALAAAAALADARGLHAVSFHLLVLAVPCAAVSALTSFGRLVDLPGRAVGAKRARASVALGALALLALVVAAAARSQASDGAVPPLGLSALVACLALLALDGVVALLVPRQAGPGAWRPSFRDVSRDSP